MAKATPRPAGLTLPPPGWCLMLSVEPILERTLRRSGAALPGRGGLPALGLVLAALAVLFLASADTVEAVGALGAAALGLGRLEAAPGTLGALEAVVEGVVALLLVELPGALLGRPGSAGGTGTGTGGVRAVTTTAPLTQSPSGSAQPSPAVQGHLPPAHQPVLGHPIPGDAQGPP